MEAEAVAEAVEVVEAAEEAVEEDLPLPNHHNSNKMLPQLQMLRQWENSLTPLTVTVQKRKTSSKKSKGTSVSIKT